MTRREKDLLGDGMALVGATVRFGTKRFLGGDRVLLISVDALCRNEQGLVAILSACPGEDAAEVDLVNVSPWLENLLRDAAVAYRQIARNRPAVARDAVRVVFTEATSTNRTVSIRRSDDKTGFIITTNRPRLVLLPHPAAVVAS